MSFFWYKTTLMELRREEKEEREKYSFKVIKTIIFFDENE